MNAQRDIVKNERREGVDNQPYGRAFEILAQATYPASHPYSWDVIGSMEDLSAATEEDVKSFFRLYYAPNNAFLSIVGDFDPAQAKAWVQKYFADIPPESPSRGRRSPGDARRRAPARLRGPRAAALAAALRPVADGWREERRPLSRSTCSAPSCPGPGRRELTKALVYDKQTAASVSAGQSTNEDVGDFVMTITPRPGTR